MLLNGFWAGAEVKGAERKSRQSQVVKLLIGVSSFSPFSACCQLGAGTDHRTDRRNEKEPGLSVCLLHPRVVEAQPP